MSSSSKAAVLTAIALACFAANSLLCRPALADARIDAATFTAIRLASGAFVLLALARGRPARDPAARPGWLPAVALFAYAAPFSFAYQRLGAAMGALVLFGSVQATMLTWGLFKGERPGARTWIGILIAWAGLIGLNAPGKGAPDPLGTVLMSIAGLSWGFYSLLGRRAREEPLILTASAFARSLPFAAVLLLLSLPTAGVHVSLSGVLLAVASGAVASGLGYSVWYAALPHLSATRAAVVQLLVPVIAAAGAALVLDEVLSARLVVASVAILGGVLLTIPKTTA